jgi:hypothetical protein
MKRSKNKMANELAVFFKQNKPVKENVFFPASKDFKDEKGNPINWELRHIPTAVMKKIEADCTTVKSNGKIDFNAELYSRKMVASAVVFPNLRNAELIDSYMGDYSLEDRTPENLIVLLLDDVTEFNALLVKVNEMQGIGDMAKKIELAKN